MGIRPFPFQSTHPRGVRPRPKRMAWTGSKFQSTHPRGVRPQLRNLAHDSQVVSIHAPARGATSNSICDLIFFRCFNPRTREGCDACRQCADIQGCVSIHAPARGATPALNLPAPDLSFQSTHPRGVRRNTITVTTYAEAVSIHAPARDATL